MEEIRVKHVRDFKVVNMTFGEMVSMINAFIRNSYARGTTYLYLRDGAIDIQVEDERHGEGISFRLPFQTMEQRTAALEAIADAEIYQCFDTDMKVITGKRFSRERLLAPPVNGQFAKLSYSEL